MNRLMATVTVVTVLLCCGSWALADQIWDQPGYHPSTDLHLGTMGAEWGGSPGFVIADPFQINLLYQDPYDNSAIDAFNAYNPSGDWTANFSDNNQYVLKINPVGNLPLYTYPSGEVAGGTEIKWTLTGWHQTIFAGDIVDNGDGRLLLRVDPTQRYRPFPGDMTVNDVEVFDAHVLSEVSGYLFNGNLDELGPGGVLEVQRVPSPGAVTIGVLGFGLLGLLRRRVQ